MTPDTSVQSRSLTLHLARLVWDQRWAIGVFGSAALMGPSRVVNVSHWPADIVASYLIGLALILSTIWLHERMLPWFERHIPFVYSLLTGDGRAS